MWPLRVVAWLPRATTQRKTERQGVAKAMECFMAKSQKPHSVATSVSY